VSKIYICSRYRADTKEQFKLQLAKTKEIAREVALAGHDVIVPHLMLTQFLDDSVESEREVGIASALRLLDVCGFLYVYIGLGVSKGMEAEIEYIKDKKIGARYFRNMNELRDLLKKEKP